MAKKKNRGQDKQRGLYDGKAGATAAQENPQAYYNALLAQSGRTPDTTNPEMWDWLQNENFTNTLTGYQTALADNERLTFKKYANKNFGQEIGKRGLKKGKKGRPDQSAGSGLAPGASVTATGAGLAGGPLGETPESLAARADREYLNFLSQENPQDWFGSALQSQGLFTGETPSDYNDFLQFSFYPQQRARYMGARREQPSLRWNQYLTY